MPRVLHTAQLRGCRRSGAPTHACVPVTRARLVAGGTVDFNEFQRGISNHVMAGASKAEMRQLFDKIDFDGSGVVELAELEVCKLFRRVSHFHARAPPRHRILLHVAVCSRTRPPRLLTHACTAYHASPAESAEAEKGVLGLGRPQRPADL